MSTQWSPFPAAHSGTWPASLLSPVRPQAVLPWRCRPLRAQFSRLAFLRELPWPGVRQRERRSIPTGGLPPKSFDRNWKFELAVTHFKGGKVCGILGTFTRKATVTSLSPGDPSFTIYFESPMWPEEKMKGLSAPGRPPAQRQLPPSSAPARRGLPTEHGVSHPGGSKSNLKRGQCPRPEVRASNKKLPAGFWD